MRVKGDAKIPGRKWRNGAERLIGGVRNSFVSIYFSHFELFSSHEHSSS